MSSLIFYSIPLFIILIGLESVWAARRRRDIYAWRDTLTCLAMGVGNVLVSLAAKGLFLALAWAVYAYRPWTVPVDAVWAWLLLLVAEDFCYYWFHRVHHECRLGWAAHVNHHSSQRFNLAVALRQSWTTPFTGVVFWLPLAWLGFHPLMILTQQAVSLLYQFWIHTQSIGRLGPLEGFLNTPSHHRVHHGSNSRYIDRNYGGIFIVWDRLFGTFEAETEPVHYGIVKNIRTFNLLTVAFHEWIAMLRDVLSARTWRDAMGYLLRHPGWTPQRSKTIRPPSA